MSIKIFYSYSHDDAELRKKLDDHLAFLRRDKVITWYDRELYAGQEFDLAIQKELNESDIILLLVSSNFLSSFYCYEIEMKAAMNKHEKGEAIVVPILLSDCVWEDAPFAKLIMANQDAKPINNPIHWNTIDEAFTNVAKNLRKTVSIAIEQKQFSEKLINTQRQVSSTRALFNEYPKPNPLFTGRTNELTKVDSYFERFPLFAIEGLGGIGKTELLARFIDKLSIDKDKILWLECTSESKFESFIEQSGYGDLLKIPDKSPLAVYSGLLSLIERDQKIIFLDNYHSLLDLTFSEFISFSANKLQNAKIILITKTEPFITGVQIPSIVIEGLTKDAIEYARKLKASQKDKFSGIDENDLAIVCETTEGHPLAIQLSLQLMTYGLSTNSLIEGIIQYKKRKDVESLIKRLFLEVYENASTSIEERELLQKFSVFKKKVKKEAIEYLIDGKNISVSISNLIDKFLISFNHGHYSTHPLIREFCHELLENKEGIHKMAASFYISHRLEILDPSLEEQIFYHLTQSNQWEQFRKEVDAKGRQFILEGQYGLLKDAIKDLKEKGIERPFYNILLGDIAEKRGDWQEADTFFHKCQEQDTEIQSKAEGILKSGEILFRKGNYTAALTYFEKALDFSKAMALKKEEARALNDIGLVFMMFGETKKTEEMSYASLTIRERLGDKEDIATSLHNISIFLSEKGRYNEALAMEYRSLNIKKDIGHKSGIADSFLNISSILLATKRSEEAEKVSKDCLKLRTEIGDKNGVAECFFVIGGILMDKGRYEEALKVYKNALVIKKEIGDINGISVSLNNIGTVLLNKDDYNAARKVFDESLEIAEKIGHKASIATSLNNIALVLQNQNEYTKAIELNKKCINIYQEIRNIPKLAISLSNLGGLYANNSLKQYDEALYFLFYSLSLFNSMEIHENLVWNAITEIRKKIESLAVFRNIAQAAYHKLDADLQAKVPLAEICKIPIKSEPKLGRNDACSCGSGKKFKNCHGK
jgi:tetratricopeptide (TPR) repeat protein